MTMMKFLWVMPLVVAVGLTTWIEGDLCNKHFKAVHDIMMRPNFELLVNQETGKIALQCSNTTINYCSNWGPIHGDYGPRPFILVVWRHLCQNTEAIEAIPSCWTSPDLFQAISSCVVNLAGSYSDMPSCIEVSVSNVEECGADAGRILRELLLKLRQAYREMDY